MNFEQIDFYKIIRRRDSTPANLDQRLRRLLSYLENRDWTNANKIKADLGFKDRVTRAVAEHSQGEILSGQKGYKLTNLCTIDELNYATGWLESQAKKMSLRSCQIRSAWHNGSKPRSHTKTM